MKKLKYFFASLLAIPFVASAASITPPITSVQDLVDLICAVFGWMFYGLVALSLVMFIVAAFNYVTGGDNAEKISKANKIILYAAIGLVVALMAKGIPLIVGNFLYGEDAPTATITACS